MSSSKSPFKKNIFERDKSIIEDYKKGLDIQGIYLKYAINKAKLQYIRDKHQVTRRKNA